jgi:hypothetical protein
LFQTLVERGRRSEAEALVVGAMIEELDIRDIADSIQRTDNQDISVVYENLMRGSRNHLRAFIKQLLARGEVYHPQYITAEDFNGIISPSPERDGKQNKQNSQQGVGRGWGG